MATELHSPRTKQLLCRESMPECFAVLSNNRLVNFGGVVVRVRTFSRPEQEAEAEADLDGETGHEVFDELEEVISEDSILTDLLSEAYFEDGRVASTDDKELFCGSLPLFNDDLLKDWLQPSEDA